MTQATTSTLKDVVEDVLLLFESTMHRQSVWVHVDVPPALLPVDTRTMKLTVYQMVADALEQMPAGGDLCIAAFVDPYMVELEVADSTSAGRAPLGHFDELETLAGRCGGRMRWIQCAQGGAARVLQIRRQQKRAAA